MYKICAILDRIELDQLVGKAAIQRFAVELVARNAADPGGIPSRNNGVVVIQHIAAVAVLLPHLQCYTRQAGLAAGNTDQVGLPRRVHLGQEGAIGERSEEHTSELQSLMRISYAVFCLKKTITPQDVLDATTTINRVLETTKQQTR